jgi:alcohol dehydrogenase class IV
MKFDYNLPINLIFGRGKVQLIGEKAKEYGNYALIVTGGKSTKKSGLLQTIEDLLYKSGISYVLFDKVTPNPLISTVYEGAKLAIKNKCDLIIAIGGGSSIDAAKAIAFQTLNGGDINDYIYGKKISNKSLPVIAVPTTCGTGSEGNGYAVLTNEITKDKKSLCSNAIIPKCSIVDPLLMTTMPKSVLVSVGFDALCHNIEAYISKAAQPISNSFALEGVKLAVEGLNVLIQNPDILEAWDCLCLASTLGGMAIYTSSVTAVHGMEHPISGLKNITHGKGLAAIAPYIYEKTIDAAPGKFLQLAKFLGGNDEYDFLQILNDLLQKIELTETLGDMGVTEDDIDWLTENCLKVSVKTIANHPVVFNAEDIKEIYRKAL